MKFRIPISILIILLVTGVAFAATRASLSSQATLAANSFSTGTVDLQISKSTSSSPTSFVDTSTPGFNETIVPGQTISEPVWLKNTSTSVDFAIAAQAASISGSLDPANVTVTFTPVSNDGLTTTGSPVTGMLTAWSSIISLGSTIAHNGGKQRYKMEVTLSPSVSTSGSINFDFIFTGAQTP